MVDDLSHLLPSHEQLEKQSSSARESSLLRQFIKWLGGKPPRGQLTVEWFHGEYPSFPFVLSTSRVRSMRVQDFFDKPTKTPAFEKFVEEFTDETTPSVLLFKSTGFTPLSMFNAPVMGGEVHVCLRFSVRGRSYFVSTMKEFCATYQERSGSLE